MLNNFPIGALGDIQVYKVKSGLNNCQNILAEEFINELDLFRIVYPDGNGFYRAVMFGYLEMQILNKNVNELIRFTFDFNNLIEKQLKGRNIQINKAEVLSIMYLIIELIIREEVELAYNYFIKSYFVCSSYDMVLI